MNKNIFPTIVWRYKSEPLVDIVQFDRPFNYGGSFPLREDAPTPRDEGAYRGRCRLGGGAHGVGTAANEADINQTASLLHGQEEAVFADAGYTGADKRPELEDCDVDWNIAIKRSIIKALPKDLRDWAEAIERALSQVRAWVEHPFHIVKNLFRHKRLRYRGLAKNTAQLRTLFALANLVIVKKTLLAPGRV